MKTEISDSARKVLDHFGLDEKDFERLDPCVDWESVARSLEDPTMLAICYVLDGNGEVVMSGGKPIRVCEEVKVENAVETLKEKSLVFVERWD